MITKTLYKCYMVKRQVKLIGYHKAWSPASKIKGNAVQVMLSLVLPSSKVPELLQTKRMLLYLYLLNKLFPALTAGNLEFSVAKVAPSTAP